MQIIVIGAGVVGVTTAWYLLQDGHEVTVIDRNSGPALETSFANAGGICPGFAGPWAAPGMPLKAARWLFQDSAPLKIRPRLDPAQWMWLAQFVANCTHTRFAHNKARMQTMAHYSKACLTQLSEETGIKYDATRKGVLQLFTTEQEMSVGRAASSVLTRLGIAHDVIEQDAIKAVEPALARTNQKFAGGIHLTTDETGDCYLFTKGLAQKAQEGGVRFLYNTEAVRFLKNGDRITGLDTQQGRFEADAYVVASGPFSKKLLADIGVSVPIYPIKGYSLTCTITDDDAAPVSSVMDEHSKVMITRLGNRLRAAGVAELAGFDTSLPESAKTSILNRVRTLFPSAANYDEIKWWCGFRPMTPDGPARIGPTKLGNLFINVGHGSNGWTQACGSSRALADIVSGREPKIAQT